MHVEEFGFGFPPRLVGFYKTNSGWRRVKKGTNVPDHTVYSVNLIPLGGFVRIMGEDNTHENDKRSFVNKSKTWRFIVLVAGVVMNFLLAVAIYSYGFAVGTPIAMSNTETLPVGARVIRQEIRIAEVVKNSPAEKSGIEIGDELRSIDGKTFNSPESVREYIIDKAGENFSFETVRDGRILNPEIKSDLNPPEGRGPVGILPVNFVTYRLPIGAAFVQGTKLSITQVNEMINGFVQLIIGSQPLSDVGGPVKIAGLTGDVAKMGNSHLLQFVAFLSINLAVLNSLPIPALDGGRIALLIVEALRRKKNNQKIEQLINGIGFSLLLLLMLVVTIKDLIHL
jgi:regulator of sigma E protease